ncbi:DUF2325 domain-containing protein [Paucibacter sp. KBW04]|uniref:DUF2325 domain-containing protein n=1 Tax=Paucibacter sp. KBW04 TaxID=2153361 RepID=UPI000F570234|nr:DUF2325 domain-containing protein [Paucibacter sp. KBW04]RQO55992.1 DUF2325 domain-containing protein [Paucibacter sp. KBW04]
MCEKKEDCPHSSALLISGLHEELAQELAAPPNPASSSRRRRLWELGSHALCPVIGVCMPMPALRRLADKVMGGQVQAEDYELHCGVIAECRLRSKMADALQKELDRRYTLSLQATAKLKHAEALAQWWREAQNSSRDLAGSFWAVITHARCDEALEHKVLGQVHMLQHQIGVGARVDQGRFEALLQENAVLGRELAQAQQRHAKLAAAQARQQEAQEAMLMRSRAELISCRSVLAQTLEQLQALQAEIEQPALRQARERRQQQQAQRLEVLEPALQAAQREARQQTLRADAAEAALQLLREQAPAPQCASEGACAQARPDPTLQQRAVLCVGGRPASVPIYQRVIEQTGGRFLHHDGGEEDNPARLDATLAAADLVICQTGCVSHNAYWRVKDHCKRTGKQCVFVETPSLSALKKALTEVCAANSHKALSEKD